MLLKLCKHNVRRWYSNRNILKLKERGMFHDIFPDTSTTKITDLCNAGPQTVYAGFDPTADSLHVGNLLVLVNLLQWQRAGHQVIALVGGATGRIGDPSGRQTERDLINPDIIAENVARITETIQVIFNNHETYFKPSDDDSVLRPVKIVNNNDWYSDISAVYLLGEIGRYFRMGTLLSRTSVQTRLTSSSGMSFTEFSYQVFQAYDWLHLWRKYKCCFQVGGNDQMGNIMSGHELISRVARKPVYGLTLPLVTNELGDKFGKSAGNAVWLSNRKSNPFTLYQFFVRTPDSEVAKLLKLFTFDSLTDIGELMAVHGARPEQRLAQKRLAECVTLLVHGAAGVAAAKLASAALYDGDLNALVQIPVGELNVLFRNAATVELLLPEAGMTVLEMAMKAKCFPTEQDAVRIITAGGFYVNHKRCSNISEVINRSCHILTNGVTLVRVGKKNYYVLKWL